MRTADIAVEVYRCSMTNPTSLSASFSAPSGDKTANSTTVECVCIQATTILVQTWITAHNGPPPVEEIAEAYRQISAAVTAPSTS